jgi:hypothetical protein
MSWKKGCLLAAVVLVALVALILGVVFYATSGVVDAADAFLDTVARGDLEAAYSQTAPAFQAQQDQAAFAAAVRDLGLTDYTARSWTSRSVEGGQATLNGTFTTAASDSVPLEMTLIKVAGEWRVFSLSGRQAGVAVQRPGEPQVAAEEPIVPPAADLAALATESVLSLNRSIVAADFSTFYGEISKLWQAQTTPEALAGAFQSFVDSEIDLGAIASFEPALDAEPAIDADGVLSLSGHYPTTPVRVVFRLRYIRESTGWELLGIQVDLKE